MACWWPKDKCRNKSVIDSILSKLSAHYGKIAPLTITWGTVYDYLGICIDFNTKEKMIIAMYDYINKIIDSLPDDIRGTAATPARSILFKVDESNATKLDAGTANLFHPYTA